MAGSEPQQPTRTERWAGPIEKPTKWQRQTATETQKTLALLLASRNKKRNTLNSFSKENAAPIDSVVQQIKINNKPIWKSESTEKCAILFQIKI
jgi:hypothetical protein